MYVAIQTLLSLYGSRERSAVCTRVDAVSVMSFSGPSFLEVVLRPQVGNNIIFHAGAQSNTILPCRQCSDVPCTQPFGSYLLFYIFRCYSAAAAQCHPCLASLEKNMGIERAHPILSE